MKPYGILFVLLITGVSSCQKKGTGVVEKIGLCSKDCKTKSMYCKLTSPELRERKATVIANLKKQTLETKELSNGYSYKFAGTDSVLDELTTFIKAERQCCSFFDFNLAVKDDKNFIWLTLTGPDGEKNFIKTELEL